MVHLWLATTRSINQSSAGLDSETSSRAANG